MCVSRVATSCLLRLSAGSNILFSYWWGRSVVTILRLVGALFDRRCFVESSTDTIIIGPFHPLFMRSISRDFLVFIHSLKNLLAASITFPFYFNELSSRLGRRSTLTLDGQASLVRSSHTHKLITFIIVIEVWACPLYLHSSTSYIPIHFSRLTDFQRINQHAEPAKSFLKKPSWPAFINGNANFSNRNTFEQKLKMRRKIQTKIFWLGFSKAEGTIFFDAQFNYEFNGDIQ